MGEFYAGGLGGYEKKPKQKKIGPQAERDRLMNLVERVESHTDGIQAVYDEARAIGYDVAGLRKIIKVRKQIKKARKQKLRAMNDFYTDMRGMLPDGEKVK
jgi:uncharacterized protein (UPF0335 family)